MGCDIHGVVQMRYSKDGKYGTDGPIEDSRNYAVFSVLADVRNGYDITPISPPRGVPADFDGDEGELGDHSFSWVTLTEVLEWPHWDTEGAFPGTTLRQNCGTFIAWIEWLALRHWIWLRNDPEAVRIVFGFDS